ncbi:MAG: sensor histidine kinase [Actinomycetes bacterium]
MTEPAAPGTAPRPGWRERVRRRSVRTRILGWLVLVAALGLALAGTASYVVQSNVVDRRVDRALTQEVAEFRTFASTGLDPTTGQRFTTLQTLFFAALQRNVPDENEGFLTLVDGEVAYYSPGRRPVRLQTLPEVVEAASRVRPGDDVRVQTVATSVGDVRMATVPVSVAGGTSAGVYVVGVGRDLEQAEALDVARTYALVAVAALLLVALVGWLVSGRLLQPVRALRETAQRITDTDLGQRIEVTGHDDLSDLARTFNGMLDRLQLAFAAQRELLDDVAHEMRTPVTILRGHVELMDAGDARDVAETRALVLDELDRMNRLVDDLLVLAKARRPDFLRWGVVHVATLVDDVLDKARPLGERRWRLDGRADVVVAGDPQRLTQALLQLAANAAAWTLPGDEVALGSSSDEHEVRLWVRDTGPGVAPEDRERIFDRFGRGAAVAGVDGVDGTGLGLPIVAAIAEAHGGRVELDSAPGRGSTFTVVLPAPTPDPGEDLPAAPASDVPVPTLEDTSR